MFFYIPVSISRHAVPTPPQITKQPPTDQILFKVANLNDNESPFLIQCEADGEPAPK